MEAHREGLPMVVRPGRRSTAMVARLNRRSTAVPGASRGGRVGWGPKIVAAGSKESQNGGGGIKEGSR
jgi:hypothetical protein